MSITTVNNIVSSGTLASRPASPSLATPASGSNPSVIYCATDTGDTFMWDFTHSVWVKIGSSFGAGNLGPSPAFIFDVDSGGDEPFHNPPGILTTRPVNIGGTGVTTLTAHGVLLGEGTSPIAATGAGAVGAMLLGGGSSADPSFYNPLQAATVTTSETTTSTSYADLTTVGPSVTMTLNGTSAIIWISCICDKTVASLGNTGYMAIAVSGASTVAASDTNSTQISYPTTSSGFGFSISRVLILTGLTAGSNTFTAKYRVDGSTFQFFNRSIAVFAP